MHVYSNTFVNLPASCTYLPIEHAIYWKKIFNIFKYIFNMKFPKT